MISEKDKALLDEVDINNFKGILYRRDTTDFNCLREVLKNHCYKMKRLGIEVEKGEKWLDLGGNIGAFGLVAFEGGASEVISYEPEPNAFAIMCENYIRHRGKTIVHCHNSAITSANHPTITFYTGAKETDRYRTSIFKNSRGRELQLKNRFAGTEIKHLKVDGIKMDIEGSEFDLIEMDLLPEANKLMMEYHFQKDRSMKNFHYRMDKLREHFSVVHYSPGFDKFPRNGDYPGLFDQFVFCKK